MRARKRFGQHFLHHKTILNRIADALLPDTGPLPPATCYLTIEIGPGQGAFTEVLVERGLRVVAIEKDRDLVPLVAARLPGVQVVVGDALELDWRTVAGAAPGEALLVTGNIPYNITSPLLAKALEPPRPERIVFLVQEEVADRLAADPGSREYGALTVGVQTVARVEKLFRVPAGAFHPRPKVHSAVVRITPLERPLVEAGDSAALRRLVVGLFGFRRKQLVRGLRELTGWAPERAAALLQQLGIEPAVRPEVLAPGDFVRLLCGLIDAGWQPG